MDSCSVTHGAPLINLLHKVRKAKQHSDKTQPDRTEAGLSKTETTMGGVKNKEIFGAQLVTSAIRSSAGSGGEVNFKCP
jgi:hypothetical protein